MKRNSILKSNFCYSILILILLLSCSNSDDNVNLSGEFIIADVETLSFQSSSVPNGVTAQIIGNTYVVQGFDSAANAIVLLINDFDGTGTYDISFSEDNNGTSGLFSNQKYSLEFCWWRRR
ncbi:hypothetical protein [Winogradskyella sp. R77965]|uniref:hypothetical protein n=1 Tax=Winogradskyella sp. R77965 TaxID=3093872 RepID=UPI0037DD37F2